MEPQIEEVFGKWVIEIIKRAKVSHFADGEIMTLNPTYKVLGNLTNIANWSGYLLNKPPAMSDIGINKKKEVFKTILFVQEVNS